MKDEARSREKSKAHALVRLVMFEGPFQDVREIHGSPDQDFEARTEMGLPFDVVIGKPVAGEEIRPAGQKRPTYLFMPDVEAQCVSYKRIHAATTLGKVTFERKGDLPLGDFDHQDLRPLAADVEEFYAQEGVRLSAQDAGTDNAPQSREPFPLVLLRSSLPIRRFRSEAAIRQEPPIGYASSCLIRYRSSVILLTVHHAVGEGIWGVEVAADYDSSPPRTSIKPLSEVVSMKLVDLEGATAGDIEQVLHNIQERTTDLDFAFKVLPRGFFETHPKLQMILSRTEEGVEIGEAPRLILTTDLMVEPSTEGTYGFAGTTQPKKSAQAGFSQVALETQCITDLRFMGRFGGFGYHFQSADAGTDFDESFQGCSGAPILDTDGRLVSLVAVGRGRDLFGVGLRQFRSAILAELSQSLPDPKDLGFG